MRYTVERFLNEELHLTLHGNATKKEFLIKGLITPPEVNLFTFLILAHTLKIDGAKKVVGFIPYLSYARHDKKERHKSQIASLLGRLMAAAGVDEVATIDLHSPHVQKLFPIPLVSLSPAPLFIKALGKKKWSFVAPDEGAIARCQAVARSKTIAWTSKTRTSTGVIHADLHGTVSDKVVIVDDILDTGMTLLSCCALLKKEGVKEIIIMVTHALFTGTAWKRLFRLGVKKIYCTDTVPLAPPLKKDKRIVVLSTANITRSIYGH